MRRRPSLVGLLLAVVLVLAAVPAPALDLDPKPHGPPVRLPGELFSHNGATEGRLLVKIGTKQVKYSRILDTAPLVLEPMPGQDGPATALSLRTAQASPDIELGRFNEVALDIRDDNPANPTLAALLVAAPDGRTFGSDPLECVDHLGETWLAGIAPGQAVDVANAVWADKNALYLARRVLDLPFDDIWRVTQDGPSTFLQRRFDRDILDLGTVDLILRRPVPVQVNLVLALDPANPRARTVLDWYALAKRTFELPDGRTVLRVSVGRYLRERHPGIKWARLQEISLMFFRQGPAEVARDRLVQRLVFTDSGFDRAELARNGLPEHLPTRVRQPFSGSRRVFVNVARAAAAMGPGGRATAELRLTPMVPASPGRGVAEGAFLALVSPRRDTPAFLAAADELAASLGAAPAIDRPDGGVSVTPLWSLAPPFAKAPGRAAGALGEAAAAPVFLSGADGLFAADGGVRLWRTAAGLTVEGAAPRLQVAANAAFAPAADANHFFRLDIGPCPGLAGIFLDVFGPDPAAGAKTYALRPGQPTPLPGLPKHVARAVLRFEFSGREFSLPITRAMLVAVPAGPAATGLYDAALPWPVTSAARPAPAGPGRTAFAPVAALGRPSWLTAAFGLVGDPVAVSVAEGSPATPDTRSGLIAGRLPDTPGPVAVATTGLGGQPPGQLELADPVFSGEAPRGWRDFFAASPLLSLGDARHGPGLVSPQTAARLNDSDGWLDIGPGRLPAKAAAIRFFDHPWYSVSALCFETDAPLHLSRLAQAPRPPAASAGLGTLGRVLAALAVLTALAAGGRLAGRQRLARLAQAPLRWLAEPAPAADRVRQRRLFGGLSAGLALAALVLGGIPGRVALGLAGLALLPVWRVLAPAVAAVLARPLPALLPWLAADAGRTYFLGLALALTAGAGLRSLGLDRLSEFCVQAGLYALVAGICLELSPQATNRAATPEDPFA